MRDKDGIYIFRYMRIHIRNKMGKLTDSGFIFMFERLVEQLENDDIKGLSLEPCVEKIAELCKRFLHRFNGADDDTSSNSLGH